MTDKVDTEEDKNVRLVIWNDDDLTITILIENTHQIWDFDLIFPPAEKKGNCFSLENTHRTWKKKKK